MKWPAAACRSTYNSRKASFEAISRALGGPSRCGGWTSCFCTQLPRNQLETSAGIKSHAPIANLLLYRGSILARLGRTQEANRVLLAARAARPSDSTLLNTFVRVITSLDRDLGQSGAGAGSAMAALLDGSLGGHPDEPVILLAQAGLSARRSQWDKATGALEALYKAHKTDGPRWFVAGTWVAGPYPMGIGSVHDEVARALPPESDPSPDRPVIGPDGKTTLPWKPANLNADGFVDLAPFLRSVRARVGLRLDASLCARESSDSRAQVRQ